MYTLALCPRLTLFLFVAAAQNICAEASLSPCRQCTQGAISIARRLLQVLPLEVQTSQHYFPFGVLH